MEVLCPRCCGLDVHKSSITACVLLAQADKPQKHIRRVGSTTRELLELVAWLREFGVEHVAMESTGVYWKPVWNVLEGHCQIVLANAQPIKAVPGRKTDTKDCQWIAELLQHGTPTCQLYPVRDDSRSKGSHPSPDQPIPRALAHCKPDPEGAGGCQHQAGECS